MIETIQNNQNNQNNKNEKKQRNNGVKLPKNIRQVGPMDGDKRVYIEDYVMTYMKQIAMKSYGNYHIAVLLGHIRKVEGEDNVFINGAVEVKDIIFDDDKVFNNESWAKIYDDIKKYFDDEEIVGWYITRPGLPLQVNEYLNKVHLDNFAGNNKVLLMYDSIEREEAFYLSTNQKLCKQDGYYIYYERNNNMQNYMVENSDNQSIEADYVDHTTINIRNVIERKNNEKVQKKRSLSVMYAAASVCALFLIVVAVTMLSGKGLRDANQAVSASNQSNKPTALVNASISPDTTQVNVQPGNINTIKDETVVGDKTNKSDDKDKGKESSNSSKDTDVNVSIEGTDPIDSKGNKDTDIKKTEDKDSTSKDTTSKDTSKEDTSTKETSSKATSYTIKRGDTLGGISMKFFKTKAYVKKIMELNKIENQDTIYAGQTIKLPESE